MVLWGSFRPLNILVLNEDVGLVWDFPCSISLRWSYLIIASTLLETHIFLIYNLLSMFTKECRIILILLTLCVLDYSTHYLFLFLLFDVLGLAYVLGPWCRLYQEFLMSRHINFVLLMVAHLRFMFWSEFLGNSYYRILSEPNFRILLLIILD